MTTSDSSPLSDQAREYADIIRQLAELQKNNKLRYQFAKPFDHSRPFGPDNIGPYDWQIDFHNGGAQYTERCLMAANRVGKSRSGGAEVAVHATGLYPDWWKGRKWNRPVNIWVGSDTNETSRDIVQKELLGDGERAGNGWIPASHIISVKYRQCGIANVAEEVWIKHASGGRSRITFKTYEQGRKKWQGTSKDLIWLDEEPPNDVFTEALTRLLDVKGLMMLTFTPLEGVGETVLHFMDGGPGIRVYNATWDDAPHLDEDAKQQLLASYPRHERETRSKGVPMVGSGAVYPIDDELIMCEPFDSIPHYWPRICGIDFGIDHPFAAVWVAWDRDSDVVYVYDCHSQSGETSVYHAEAIKKRGEWIPVSWPHDGMQREKSSGVNLADQFRQNHKVNLLGFSARYNDEQGGSQAIEPGVYEIYERMLTGRFKVCRHLHPWFREKRMYHRKDGRIVTNNDDLMSATRYATMMLRHARVQGPGPARTSNSANYDPIQYV